MKLRPYQQEAVDASIAHMKASTAPFLIDAATGAGKSLMIAALADHIHKLSGKRILCLAPSAELVVQNRGKYLANGNPASLFSASVGQKSTRYPVVFGTPLTVKNNVSRFGSEYAMVVIDECHGITPTLISIIDYMREKNQNLRICGMTATPYRMGTGYIFREWPDGTINGDDTARDPYFDKCVYSVHARDLIDAGFLTRPVIGGTCGARYDTGGLAVNKMGKFNANAVDVAYHGHGRKTAAIVTDIVTQARNRRGVMIFAATVRHANEVLASLPPELSAIITGGTPKKERAALIERFKAKRIKYLVNVSVLTTGFDAPHVDLIALLRKTESVGLLQQIIGRGLRVYNGKTDCLVLDYTTNLTDHCPDGDLFAPVIQAGQPHGAGGGLKCVCEECGYVNNFTAKKDCLDYKKDENGYCLDLYGHRVSTEYGQMSGHYGRRCMGFIRVGNRGEYVRCGYRWTSKECQHCLADNDIAARYCVECKGEIIDPNDKLIAEFKALKRDPTQMQTDMVVSMTANPGISRAGNKTIRIEWVTPYRQFTTWLQPEAAQLKGQHQFSMWEAVTGSGTIPSTITYRKNAATGFFDVLAYNRQADIEPEVNHAAE